MPSLRPAAILAIGASAFASTAGERPILPALPLDAPVAPLLERWRAEGACSLPDRQPWNGEDVVECLHSIRAQGGVDSALAERFLPRLDLRESGGGRLPPTWRSGPDDDPQRDLLRLDVDVTGHLDVSGQDLVYGNRPDAALHPGSWHPDTSGHTLIAGGRIRPRVDVLLGRRVAMWSRARFLTEGADVPRYYKTFDARRGMYQTALFAGPEEYGHLRTHDWIEGAIEAQTPWLRLSAGIEPLRWGPAPLDALAFSGRSEGMAHVSASHRIGAVSAEVLVASLIGDTFEEDRTLYAHRYVLAPASAPWGLVLGWNETTIRVERRFEPLYVIPVFPFLLTEHFLGDPDNRQMGFEASIRPHRRLRVSAELFLDDLQNYFGFLDDGWGNKWGLSLGLSGAGWTGARSLDRLQATRIEPWVYSSSARVQPGTPRNLPVHFGALLGHPAGPNSLDLSWDHRQDISERLSWSLGLRALWKGTDLGSSPDDLNWSSDSTGFVPATQTKKWLDGKLIDRQEVRLGAEWRLAGLWRAGISLGAVHRDSLGSSSIDPELSLRVGFRE